MKKRLLAALLALVMVCSLFVGCDTDKPQQTQPSQSQNQDPKPTESKNQETEPAEPVKITWLGYYTTKGLTVAADSWVEQLLEENFNLDITAVTDVTDENFDTFLGSGEILDITCFSSRFNNDYAYLYDQGLIREIPVEWLYEYYPTGMALLNQYVGEEFIEGGGYLIDGKCFAVPHNNTSNTTQVMVGYRKDWLDNLGLKEPTTLQEFHDMLYAFTYNDPDGNGKDDTYGMEVVWDNYGLSLVYTALGFSNRSSKGNYMVDENGKVTYTCTSDAYKQALAIIKEWYDEGILHPEGLTDDRSAQRAKWGSGTVGCVIDAISWFWGAGAAQLMPMVELTYGEGTVAMLNPITSEYGGQMLGDGTVYATKYAPGSGNTSDTVFTAEATDEQVIAVLKMLEGLSTNVDLYAQLYYGKKGEDWELVNGAVKQAEHNSVEYKASIGAGTYFRNAAFPYELNMLGRSESDIERIVNVANKWPMREGIYTTDAFASLTPLNEAYSLYSSEVSACEKEFYSNVLLGVVDLETGWEAYVKEMNDIGLAEIIAEYEELLK